MPTQNALVSRPRGDADAEGADPVHLDHYGCWNVQDR
jgi:hypothetical protein